MDKTIICCDWGSSSLRVYWINKADATILKYVSVDIGILDVFEAWKKHAVDIEDNEGRAEFYLVNLQRILISSFADDEKGSWDMPVIISGMVSSSVGMVSLPYAKVPFSIDGKDAILYRVSCLHAFSKPVTLISGVQCENEVMRGEETQIVGVSDLLTTLACSDNTILVLPGTHSKHVYLQKHKVTKIQTYVTGELFAILIGNGFFKEAIQKPTHSIDETDWEVFKLGVMDSSEACLLNALFRIRTNQLFCRLKKHENYWYLSGLLIGYELKSLKKERRGMHIVLGCGSRLFPYYTRAIDYLGLSAYSKFIDQKDMEFAVVKGQMKIANKFFDYDEI